MDHLACNSVRTLPVWEPDNDRIGAFRPVSGPLLISQGNDAARDSLVDINEDFAYIVEDVINQVGVRSQLDALRPSPSPA